MNEGDPIDVSLEKCIQVVRFPHNHKENGRWWQGPLIGDGGFGRVYEVEDDDGVHGAMKIYSNSKLDKTGVLEPPEKTFRNETRALRQLNHPGITRYLDSFLSSDLRDPTSKQYAIVMTHEGGTGLNELIGTDEYTKVPTVIDFGLQSSHAIMHAQEHNIVHRNLKPRNIRRRDNGSYAILDFGTARTFTDGLHTSYTNIDDGERQYLAPEAGYDGKPQTDLYSIAMIMLNMLRGENSKVIEVREEDRGLAPAGLIALIEKNLAGNYVERSANAKEFFRDLEKLAGEPIVRETVPTAIVKEEPSVLPAEYEDFIQLVDKHIPKENRTSMIDYNRMIATAQSGFTAALQGNDFEVMNALSIITRQEMLVRYLQQKHRDGKNFYKFAVAVKKEVDEFNSVRGRLKEFNYKDVLWRELASKYEGTITTKLREGKTLDEALRTSTNFDQGRFVNNGPQTFGMMDLAASVLSGTIIGAFIGFPAGPWGIAATAAGGSVLMPVLLAASRTARAYFTGLQIEALENMLGPVPEQYALNKRDKNSPAILSGSVSGFIA